MTTVTALTAARMLGIEAGSIVSGAIVGNDLILTKHDGTTVNAGNVRGPAGPITTSKLGDLKFKALNIADPGWALCDGGAETEGDLYSALLAAGNPYGTFEGNPRRPDYRDRFPIGAGTTYSLGATGGEASHILSANEMPAHTHTLTAPTVISSDTGGTNGWLDTGDPAGRNQTYTTDSKGGGQPHNNLPPYLACFVYIYTLDSASESEAGSTVLVLTQAEYDALATPDPDTLYVISD